MRGSWLLLSLGVLLLAAVQLAAAPQPVKMGSRPENFTLARGDGKQIQLHQQPMPRATVVLFIATACPVSLAYDRRMAQLAAEYSPRGIRFLGVNSNKQETPEAMAAHAERRGFGFDVVKDPNNVIADRWGATVTPEAYVLDEKGVLIYHGRIDDSQSLNRVQSTDLKNALEAVLAGKRPDPAETKPFGCTIKRVP